MEHKPATPSIEAAHAALPAIPAVRRPAGLRGRRPRLPRRARARGRARGRRPGRVGQRRLRLPRRATRPDTVHPSLWRQSQLVAKQGLFEVVEGIYQVRGLDLSNMTFVEGDTGRHRHRPADLDRDRGRRARRCTASTAATGRSTAVIYTHCHVDHFGGVNGVTTQDDVDAGEVADPRARGLPRARGRRERLRRHRDGAAAPATCTARRSTAGPQGQVGAGLGQTTSTGDGRADRADRSTSPRTGQEETVDGVEIVFQMTPGHRGAGRDALLLPRPPGAVHGRERHPHPAQPADPARRAGARPARLVAATSPRRSTCSATDADVAFASHHWPTWGSERDRRVPRRRSATSTPTCTTRRCGC